jgi:hypothetical protein
VGHVIEQMRDLVQRLVDADEPALHEIATALELGIVALEQAVAFIVSNYGASWQRYPWVRCRSLTCSA